MKTLDDERSSYVRLIAPGLLMIACAGCAASAPQDEVPSAVYRAWREKGSYYALLEIVDAHIDPSVHSRVSKADVRGYLGPGADSPDLYPNAGPDFWVYFSSRRVPFGSYLFVEFDKAGFVKEISWGSE